MFNRIKKIIENIKHLSAVLDKYKSESVIQSLPSVAYVNKAKGLIENRNFDEAEEVLLKALDISSQDSRVYKYLGKIYEQRMKFEQAAGYYEQSAKINPQDKEIWLRLGMCQLNSQMVEQALKSFEKANKVTPFNTDVYTGWGMGLMKQRKYAFAHDKFITAAKISKYNYTAILLSAIMEVKLLDYDSAEEKLNFLAKAAPNESSCYEYANLKLLKSDYDEAEKFAKKSIEYNKQMLPAYLVLGDVYSIRKDLDKAEKVFNSALENDLESPSLRNAWGIAYIRLFEFEKAGAEFSKALNLEPYFLPAKIGLALTNAYKNDFTLLEELKEQYGTSAYIQEALGLKELYEHKAEDAIDYFKKALNTDPKQSYNYYNLVMAYKLLNDRYKIREYYDKFISENPDYIKGFISYAEWLIKVSDFEEAKRKLTRAQKIDKDNAEVLNLLFLCLYTLVKKNICEYNIKEAISVALNAQAHGKFDYENEKQELENILKDIQGNN